MNRTWDALLALAFFAWLFMLAGFGDLFVHIPAGGALWK